MPLFGSGTLPEQPVYFPGWATDLQGVSTTMRNSWEAEIAIRQKYYRYFSGQIFEETVPGDVDSEEETPLLYPVGINLVRLFSMAISDSIFGEWEESVVKWSPALDDNLSGDVERASSLANEIMSVSDANVLFWENALEREVYGGGAIKIWPYQKKVRWSRVSLWGFFPVWNPEDIDDLLEVYMVSIMTPEQAKLRYGVTTDKQIVHRVEHWTKNIYENHVDGKKVAEFSGTNPWGVVPIVYIPRFRANSWWGESLTEEIYRVQDELNERIADIGDAINYSAHPIRYGINMPTNFNSKNYPVGPNQFWDLGKAMNRDMTPQVGILEAKQPIPAESAKYTDFLHKFSMSSASVPPIALGIEEGGGQRSGITLEIHLNSLVRAIRRSRAYLTAGLSRAMRISAIIMKQRSIEGVPSRALERILEGDIVPVFSSILPRDMAAIVDMVQKAMSTPVPLISVETSVKKMGLGSSEVAKIDSMLEKHEDAFSKGSKDNKEPSDPDARAGVKSDPENQAPNGQ